MSPIRPELRAGLRRWREALAGLAVALAGLWLGAISHGITLAFGLAAMLGGAALLVAGLQLGRFRIRDGGPGLVEVTEAQIAYFAAPASLYQGGAVALGALVRIELDWRLARRRGHPPEPLWLLSEAGRPPLLIPASAGNAEALFGAFAALPGLQTERMLAALARPQPERVLVWQAPGGGAAGRAVPGGAVPDGAGPSGTLSLLPQGREPQRPLH